MVGVLVNFSPLYAEIERYYYDKDEDQIVKTDGNNIKNRYDDSIVIHRIR